MQRQVVIRSSSQVPASATQIGKVGADGYRAGKRAVHRQETFTKQKRRGGHHVRAPKTYHTRTRTSNDYPPQPRKTPTHAQRHLRAAIPFCIVVAVLLER